MSFALFCLLLGPASSRAATPDLTALLGKLAAQETAIEHTEATVDFTRHERDEDLDSDHHPKHVVERWVRVTHPGGKEHEELLKETRDGEDITAQTRPRFDEAQAEYREAKAKDPKRRDTFAPQSPFKASEQGKYVFTFVTGADGSAGSAVRLRFTPKGETPDTYAGEAWVNGDSQQTLRLELHPPRPERFVDQASVTLEYGATAGQPVVTRRVTVSEGGILFLKKRFRGVVERE